MKNHQKSICIVQLEIACVALTILNKYYAYS